MDHSIDRCSVDVIMKAVLSSDAALEACHTVLHIQVNEEKERIVFGSEYIRNRVFAKQDEQNIEEMYKSALETHSAVARSCF